MKLRCDGCGDLVTVSAAGTCTSCGRLLPLGRGPTETSEPARKPLVGVRGWLLFFVICITIVSPALMTAAVLSVLLQSPERVSLLSALVQFGLAALLVVIGSAMWRRQRWGLQAVRVLLAAMALFEASRFHGAPGQWGGLIGACIWLWYLQRSERVRNTYASPTTPAVAASRDRG